MRLAVTDASMLAGWADVAPSQSPAHVELHAERLEDKWVFELRCGDLQPLRLAEFEGIPWDELRKRRDEVERGDT